MFLKSEIVSGHALFLLLLTQTSAATQPINVQLGDDVILPCQLEPAADVATMTLEWAKPNLTPRYVHVRRDGVDLLIDQNPAYIGRTLLFVNKLKCGDVSLKLSKVKLSDEGTYTCFIPSLGKRSTVKLVVSSVSSPVIEIIKGADGVLLQCKSAGWYPEPEVLWLDAEGLIVSAGPTDTLRGPDGLYTVSSSVTVDNKHSNTFTCKLQQVNITQTLQTRVFIQGTAEMNHEDETKQLEGEKTTTQHNEMENQPLRGGEGEREEAITEGESQQNKEELMLLVNMVNKLMDLKQKLKDQREPLKDDLKKVTNKILINQGMLEAVEKEIENSTFTSKLEKSQKPLQEEKNTLNASKSILEQHVQNIETQLKMVEDIETQIPERIKKKALDQKKEN
ncbi:butyrophilin subfamily 2 member A2-like isoform X2 [Genypterus blacodes]|uniref:butyrophilin subfamily 2 member A2-like isoform X2 n=1 Tax=Genypterus blacodes TaxID=154954 RepID=UPI003F76393F